MATLRRPRFASRMQISGSGPSEMVYRGRLPALQYHVSYSLDDVDGQRYLTITTAIHYRHWLALLYGGGVRFVQWGLAPMAALRRPAFARRMEIRGVGPSEIVYRGQLPALRYHVAYSLDDVAGQPYLTVTTAVHYRHWLGMLYGGGVRFVQWGLVPMAASRLVERSSGP